MGLPGFRPAIMAGANIGLISGQYPIQEFLRRIFDLHPAHLFGNYILDYLNFYLIIFPYEKTQ
jgi:hypothetical protein